MKRKTKIIDVFKFMINKWHREFANENLQRKLDDLGFKNNQCENLILKNQNAVVLMNNLYEIVLL